jgi:hypothetical protein
LNEFTQQQRYTNDDRFSPRKFILQVQSTTWFILSKWWLLLLVSVLMGTIGYFYSSSKKTIYIAEITFALDEEASIANRSSITQLSEQLGLGSAGDGGSVFFNSMTNIVELLKSRLLVEKTLKDSVAVDGKKILMADFFLDSLEFRKKWMKRTGVGKLNLLDSSLSKEDALYRNGIFAGMCDMITNQFIKIEKKGIATSIVSVKCISTHELFSKYFLEAHINKVTQYYTDIKTERAKKNLELIQRRADSTRSAFTGSLYTKAAFSDANMNPSRQVAVIATEKQQTDVQILKASYIELVKGLESAKASLIRDTPIFQYLDTPMLPLKTNRSNSTLYFIVFAILGLFLTTGFLLMKRLYQAILDRPY